VRAGELLIVIDEIKGGKVHGRVLPGQAGALLDTAQVGQARRLPQSVGSSFVNWYGVKKYGRETGTLSRSGSRVYVSDYTASAMSFEAEIGANGWVELGRFGVPGRRNDFSLQLDQRGGAPKASRIRAIDVLREP
jgi:hypothetical protein